MNLVGLIILQILLTSVFTIRYYPKHTSESHKVTVLTLATADIAQHKGLKRFLTSARLHGIAVELLGKKKNYTGFGQKYNLVRKKLHKLSRFGIDERIILYTDSYDVMFLSGLDAIVRRFKEFLNTRILFTAGKGCWPDPTFATRYPKSKVNPYLNAGGFIGYLRELLQLMKERILDSDDDQLYFTKAYVDTEIRTALHFKLDHYNRIFLATFRSNVNVKINAVDLRPYLVDEVTKQRPLIGHFNGPHKPVLDKLAKYLAPSWPYNNSCTLSNTKFVQFKQRSLPFVMLAVFIEEHTPYFHEFLQLLLDIDYPKKNLHLILRNNVKYHEAEVEKFYQKYSHEFATAKLIKPSDSLSDADARHIAKEGCIRKITCNYMFVIDSLSRVRKDTLRYLMNSGPSVIAPMMRRTTPSQSSFWGCNQITSIRGIWKVPFITNCYLLHLDLIPKKYKTLTYHSDYLSPDLALCDTLTKFDAAKAPSWAVTPKDEQPIQSDQAEARSAAEPLRPSERDLYIDDDGSGLESDESSGSGWGPGPDDEDSRGSGDDAPEDDEDYHPARSFRPASTTSSTTQPPDTTVDTLLPTTVNNIDVEIISRGQENSRQPEGGAPEQPRAPEPRPDQTDINISAEDINTQIDQDLPGTAVGSESRPVDNVVFIMNAKPEDRATSFFAQPGILAAVIGGAVVGLLCAILVVMFIVYRMRKKDEGSYALDEPKRSPAAASYGKGQNNREFYA